MRNASQEGCGRVRMGALVVVIAGDALFTYGTHAPAAHFLVGHIIGISISTAVSVFTGSRGHSS